MSGPKPVPDNVRAFLGAPPKKSLNDQLDSVNPDVEIPDCPPHLMSEAKAEWRRISEELVKLRLIAKIDRAALALYCQAWARWVWAEKKLRAAVKLAEERREAFEADPANTGKDWMGGDGYTVVTPNGQLGYSPHWVIANKAMDQVDKFLQSFGLSPSARTRIRPSAQLDLFPATSPQDGHLTGATPSNVTRFFTEPPRPGH